MRDIRVTALDAIRPFYEDGRMERKDPLGALRELDATVASRYGVRHCRVLGFDLNLDNHRAPAVLTSHDEFVVDVNPPELPA